MQIVDWRRPPVAGSSEHPATARGPNAPPGRTHIELTRPRGDGRAAHATCRQPPLAASQGRRHAQLAACDRVETHVIGVVCAVGVSANAFELTPATHLIKGRPPPSAARAFRAARIARRSRSARGARRARRTGSARMPWAAGGFRQEAGGKRQDA